MFQSHLFGQFHGRITMIKDNISTPLRTTSGQPAQYDSYNAHCKSPRPGKHFYVCLQPPQFCRQKERLMIYWEAQNVQGSNGVRRLVPSMELRLRGVSAIKNQRQGSVGWRSSKGCVLHLKSWCVVPLSGHDVNTGQDRELAPDPESDNILRLWPKETFYETLLNRQGRSGCESMYLHSSRHTDIRVILLANRGVAK